MRLRVALVGLAFLLVAPFAEAQPAPTDAPPDTPTDAPPDTPTDAPTDAPTDTQPETEENPAEDGDDAVVETPPVPTEPDPVDDGDGNGDSDRGASIDPEPVAPEDASTGFPRVRFVWRNLFAGRLNPLGLINRFNVGWRVQILDKPGKLYKDSQFSILFHTALSPAFTHVGGRIEIQPLTIARLGLTYAFMGSHGIFDFVQPYDDPNAEFDDKTLDDREDLNQATVGYYVEPGLLLQAALGPVAIRNETKFYFRSVRGVPDNGYFWDPTLDVLFPNDRWAMTNDADLLFLFDFGLTVGARYTLTHVFYDEDVDLNGPAGDNVTTHRVGPAILYKFFEDDPPTAFNAPLIGVLAQWWAAHRYRTGSAPAAGLEDRSVSQALPYLLLFFRAQGDFFPTEPATPPSE